MAVSYVVTKFSDNDWDQMWAGANLATINLTPAEVREDYLLYTRNRYIMDEERVLSAIEDAGCRAATTQLIARD